MGLTNIQWADYTFNAWMGCRKVAEECANCYIVETPPFRFRGIRHGSQRERTSAGNWKLPLQWNRQAEQSGQRPRVFSLSLGDWLDDEIPIEWLADLLRLIDATPCLDWLLLTKRPQNWRRRIEAALALESTQGNLMEMLTDWVLGGPPANVWIGVSQGADQAAALAIPASLHFLSCEPMLRPLDTTRAAEFDWIIFGGESGRKARICDLRWIRDGLAFCAEHEVAAFVKQFGALPVLNGLSVILQDSHGGDILECPTEFRVREFPVLTRVS